MNIKVIGNKNELIYIYHIISQGTINPGFNSIEEAKKEFGDDLNLHATYINEASLNKIYAIRNIKTNKLVSSPAISNPSRRYFEKVGYAKNALDRYTSRYITWTKNNKYDLKNKSFYIDNNPVDLEIILFSLLQDNINIKE